MPSIHPTAVVDPRARLADDVRIGEFVVIKGPVQIGAGTVVQECSVLRGGLEIGTGCSIGPAAYVGLDPQHTKFVANDEAPTWLIVGDNVTIRETASLHRSTKPGRENATRVGDGCYIMGSAHVGHDCIVGAGVTMANGAMLGGHAQIGDRVFIGGGAAIHQFVRVGRLAIVGGNEALSQDAPPFSAVRNFYMKGYNAVGCRRAGMSREALSALRGAFNRLRDHRVLSAAVAAIRAELPQCAEIREMLEFIGQSKRGIVRSRTRTSSDESGDE